MRNPQDNQITTINGLIEKFYLKENPEIQALLSNENFVNEINKKISAKSLKNLENFSRGDCELEDFFNSFSQQFGEGEEIQKFLHAFINVFDENYISTQVRQFFHEKADARKFFNSKIKLFTLANQHEKLTSVMLELSKYLESDGSGRSAEKTKDFFKENTAAYDAIASKIVEFPQTLYLDLTSKKDKEFFYKIWRDVSSSMRISFPTVLMANVRQQMDRILDVFPMLCDIDEKEKKRKFDILGFESTFLNRLEQLDFSWRSEGDEKINKHFPEIMKYLQLTVNVYKALVSEDEIKRYVLSDIPRKTNAPTTPGKMENSIYSANSMNLFDGLLKVIFEQPLTAQENESVFFNRDIFNGLVKLFRHSDIKNSKITIRDPFIFFQAAGESR